MSDQRQLWCIKEQFTGAWCKSAKFSHFGSFDEASIYVSASNAAKAIKDMNASFDRGNTNLYINEKHIAFCGPEDDDDYRKMLEKAGYIIAECPRPSFEAAPCLLST